LKPLGVPQPEWTQLTEITSRPDSRYYLEFDKSAIQVHPHVALSSSASSSDSDDDAGARRGEDTAGDFKLRSYCCLLVLVGLCSCSAHAEHSA
jgi:hypothetical protein